MYLDSFLETLSVIILILYCEGVVVLILQSMNHQSKLQYYQKQNFADRSILEGIRSSGNFSERHDEKKKERKRF